MYAAPDTCRWRSIHDLGDEAMELCALAIGGHQTAEPDVARTGAISACDRPLSAKRRAEYSLSD
eukprot:scaffold39629_cov320-Isochrysis_galbana.AAC.1